MAVIELRENPLHGGLTEDRRALLDSKTVTILLDGSHLLIIQIDDLPMNSSKRCLAHFKIVRIWGRSLLFFSCQNLLVLPAFRAASTKLSIFDEKNDLEAILSVKNNTFAEKCPSTNAIMSLPLNGR